MEQKRKHFIIISLMGFFLLLQICWFFINKEKADKDVELEYALNFALSNRSELEKVLKHYAHDPQKYEAAEFLIKNMPMYFSYKGAALDSLEVVHKIYNTTHEYDKKRFDFLKSFPYNKLEKEYDAHHVKAGFLIENIDQSFKVWKETPWGKYISFDDFCEFILPYRVKNEPLSCWKRDLYSMMRPALDSLYKGTDVVTACDSINRYLYNMDWTYFNEFNPPHCSASYLLENRIGNCKDVCDFRIYMMRSIGIPVVTDMYLYSPDLAYSHSWNVVLDTTGCTIPFHTYEVHPKRGGVIDRKKGKIYRNCYAVQLNERMKESAFIYGSLCMKDVSADYFQKNKIDVTCDFLNKEATPVFLSVFALDRWVPIAASVSKNKQALFTDLENKLIYTPIYYEGGKMKEAGYPFVLNNNKVKKYFCPDLLNTQTITLYRKYPLTKSMRKYMTRVLHGKVEGANREDFRDAETIFTINDSLVTNDNSVILDSPLKYRFVRYVTPANSTGDIAELSFFSHEKDTLPLSGKICGSDSYQDIPEFLKKNAFDGDILTFFAAEEKGGWVGLDFGSPKRIHKISYFPRNDDNFIRKNEIYELFYFLHNGWCSLGAKRGDKGFIVFDNVPGNTLLWLHNHSKGKEEHIFYYENGKQIFVYDI